MLYHTTLWTPTGVSYAIKTLLPLGLFNGNAFAGQMVKGWPVDSDKERQATVMGVSQLHKWKGGKAGSLVQIPCHAG